MRFLLLVLTGIFLGVSYAHAGSDRMLLNGGWMVQSSDVVRLGGDQISSPSLAMTGWHPTKMPSTVFNSLLEDGAFKDLFSDPFYGTNLRKAPGMDYAIDDIFDLRQMPAGSPFIPSWWYRTQFTVSARAGQRTHLHLDGINYRANLWLNGRKLADSDEIQGTFRQFDLDVTDALSPSGVNTLAVEVFAGTPTDLGTTWVDWNPGPADKNMGLWRDVYLTTTGAIVLRDARVTPALNSSYDRADLTVTVLATNESDQAVDAFIEGRIESALFHDEFHLNAHESRKLSFDHSGYPLLRFEQPRLWWPAQMGAQNLYELRLRAFADGQQSDSLNQTFGIREVTSELIDNGSRLFKINGKPILIRGGGWAPNIFLRSSPEREEQELRYVRDLNLNAIRFEGKFESDHFLDLADRMGILTLPGWACCSHWEHGADWTEKDFEVAEASFRDQLRRHFNHPSTLVFLYGSDIAPPQDVEKMYLRVLQEEGWPMPAIASAADDTTLNGNTGVKMTGPYDYVPPSYWYLDTSHGGAYGFNTETSVGPAVPPLESLVMMLPPDHWWPIDDTWNFHAGQTKFHQINLFKEAMERRYGGANSIAEFAERAQTLAYDGHRAMFEAYTRNKYKTSTGVIQWMLNNGWPSLIWHLYDYYLRPGGSYFGAKKALEPLHIQYSYDDRSVVAVSSQYEDVQGLFARAQVFNFDLTPKFDKEVALDLPADSSNSLFEIPQMDDLSTTYFLKLTLRKASGEVVSSNFYWLSTKAEVYEWLLTDFTHTPLEEDADLTALATLQPATVSVQSTSTRTGTDGITRVTLQNTSKVLAFQVHAQVTAGDGGNEILPVLWSDNYVTLLPGESRELVAQYRLTDLGGASPKVAIRGWNVAPARR